MIGSAALIIPVVLSDGGRHTQKLPASAADKVFAALSDAIATGDRSWPLALWCVEARTRHERSREEWRGEEREFLGDEKF